MDIQNQNNKTIMAWYNKYLSIYGKPFSEVPESVIHDTRQRLAAMQSKEPLISIVVIAHNEEYRLPACLWSLSEIKTSYPIEILGVNNSSDDKTEEIYKTVGIRYFNEIRKSPGYARKCGLDNSHGKYHFFIDADTLYPPQYVEVMMQTLTKKGVACVGAFWSFYPDKQHSALSLIIFEIIRDAFLFLQHFKRPELCVRGMTFAFNADYAKKIGIRTDIRRGEDGSLALGLKKYGKIAFVYSRKARTVTGYGTVNESCIWKSLLNRIRIQGKGIMRIFTTKAHYEDSDDNIIKPK